jgi:hypothetical protein
MSYHSEESIDIGVVNRIKWTHTLAREGVDDLLFDTLLTLGQSLVLPTGSVRSNVCGMLF